MGLGLFFWWARWPGGAGFAGTADIVLRNFACKVQLFVYLACVGAKEIHNFETRN